jgi:group I intron endonuclease
MNRYSIYKFTNENNGKVYIGKTIHSPEKRKLQHFKDAKIGAYTLLHRAIRKHGQSVFSFEVIFNTFEATDLNFYETYFIKTYDCCLLDGKDKGYNMTRGGDGIGSEQLRIRNLAKMKDGSHNFANGGLTKLNQQRINDGSHHFLGEAGSNLQLSRMTNGTHNWANGNLSKLQRDRVANGTHNLLKGSVEVERRKQEGVYAYVGQQTSKAIRKLLHNGTSHLIQTTECPHCGKQGKGPMMKRWHFDNCKIKNI